MQNMTFFTPMQN